MSSKRVRAFPARAVAFHDAPRLGQIGKFWATLWNPDFLGIESPPPSATRPLK
jgi:hypothetical protein